MTCFIPPSNYTLYETFCENLCDEIERVASLPQTPVNKRRLVNKQFLLDRFTWMIQADMGHSGAPGAILEGMFSE